MGKIKNLETGIVLFDHNRNFLQYSAKAKSFFEKKLKIEANEIKTFVFEKIFCLKHDLNSDFIKRSAQTKDCLLKLLSINFKEDGYFLLEVIENYDQLNTDSLNMIESLVENIDNYGICLMNFSSGKINGSDNLMKNLEVPKEKSCTILTFRDNICLIDKKEFDQHYSKAIDGIDRQEVILRDMPLQSYGNKKFSYISYSIAFYDSEGETSVATIFRPSYLAPSSELGSTLSNSSFYDDILELTLNKHFKIIDANNNFFLHVGLEKKPLIQTDFRHWVLNYKEEYDQLINNNLLKGVSKYSFPCFLKTADGNSFSAYVNLSVIREGEKISRIKVLIIKLNPKFELRDQIEGSFTRLKTLVMRLNLGVLVEKPGRIIDFVNKTFCDLFQIPLHPSDLKGQNCENSAKQTAPMFKNPDDFLKRIDEILTKNKPVFGEMLELKNGKVYSRDFIPLTDNQTGMGLIWQYQDVTETIEEKKRLKQNLNKERELKKAISSLLSTASHQLRTPIAVVDSNIQLLQEITDKPNELQERIFNRINKEFNRFRLLLDDILVAEKLRAGKVTTTMAPKNIVDIIKELKTRSFNPYVDGRSLRIVVEGNPQNVLIDSHLFDAVIQNVLSNAFKYSPNCDAPRLTISFNVDFVKVLIKDYGIGIPRSEQRNLFSNFFRASNAKEYQGSGLGLNIAKEYLKRMNGDLSFESIEGKGSTFFITLPLI